MQPPGGALAVMRGTAGLQSAAHGAPLPGRQVAYRTRVRERFFGPDYEREVRWIDGGGAQQPGGGSKAAAAGGEPMAQKKEE